MALTTSWVTYKTISVTLPTGYTSYVYIQAKLNSQSTANNTSNVSVRARVKYGYPWYAASAIKIRAGKGSSSGSYNEYTHTYTSSSKATTTEHTTASWTGNIAHNTDGTGTLPLYGYIYQKEWSVNKSTTGSVALPTIPRASQPTVTPNPFNIGDTITINTNRKVSTYTDDLQMVIGGSSYVIGQEETGEFTYDTSIIANDIYAEIPNASSYTNVITNTTYNGDTVVGTNTTSYTANVVNAEPTFTLGYRDTNSTTTAITGNNQQIIRNQSTLQINITNASALYGASLVSASADINGNIYTGSFNGSSLNINVGTVELSSNENAIVTVTDSRGLSTTKSVELQILDWQLPSAIIECARQNNYYTETNVKVDADYSSLDNHNTITITFKYKKTTDSTYTSTTLQDNVATVINMDNLYDWDIQVIVADAFGSTTYNLTLNKGVPLIFFDRKRESVSIGCFPQRDETIEVYGVDLLQDKQDTLVSGTNIKTINNTSLLGSGNINISSGGTATDVEINGTSITSNNTANIAVDGTYNASTNKIATMSSLPTGGNSASAVSTTASGGSATTYSKSDHKHSISSGTITSALGFTPYDSSNPNGYTSNTGTMTDSQINGTSIVTSGVANFLTNTAYDSSTNKIATMSDIPSVGNSKIYYGTSSTAAATQTKAVTCSGFVLETGATVVVKFTYAQTYNGVPKLNVNSTGAINVRYKGDTNGIRYMWNATEVMAFTYDGTYWVAQGRGLATTTYYGVTKLTTSGYSTSTATALTPASLNNVMQYLATGLAAYSSSATYAVGDRVRYGNYMYECNTAITTAEAWTAAHWTALPDLLTQINGKQATLVSGTNIKTINNESILGSGNITIGGGGGTSTDVQVNGTSIVVSDVANISTNGTYNSSTNKFATMDSVYNATALTNSATDIMSLDLGIYEVSPDASNGINFTYYTDFGVTTDTYNFAVGQIFRISKAEADLPVKLIEIFDDTGTLTMKIFKLIDGSILGLQYPIGNISTLATTDQVPTDTGWQTLTKASGISNGNQGGVPQYRKIGNHVFLRGMVSFTASSSQVTLATLPANIRPQNLVYKMVATGGARIGRLVIDSTSGNLAVDWVYRLDATSAITSGTINWFDIEMDYFTD